MKVLDSIETLDGDVLATLIDLDNAAEWTDAVDYDGSDFAAPIEEQEAAMKKICDRLNLSILSFYNMVSR